MEACTIPQTNHGIMDEDDDDELGCPSSSSSSSFSSGDSSNSNDSSEFMDDATSSSSSSSSSKTSSPSLEHQQEGALYEMSSLMAHLPFKRGLSKHFEGKSQSFTSMSKARCLEDLAKPERACRKKKLKLCTSHGGGLDANAHRPCSSPKGCCSRAIAKKPSRGVWRQGGFRPPNPMPPHRSNSFSAQSLLFA